MGSSTVAEDPKRSLRIPPRRDAVTTTFSGGALSACANAGCASPKRKMTAAAELRLVRRSMQRGGGSSEGGRKGGEYCSTSRCETCEFILFPNGTFASRLTFRDPRRGTILDA